MKTRSWVLFTTLVLILIAWLCYQPGARFTSAQETGWTEPRPISETICAGWAQELAVDAQGLVHAVWIGDPDGDEYEDAIFYSVWDGIEWSEPVDVFYATRGGPFIPAIAVDPKGEIHIVFDWRGVEGIYYMHAPAEAAGSARAWSAPITINDGVRSYFSYVAVDREGTIHAVWEDRGEGQEIFYSQLKPDADQWSTPVNLSSSLHTMSTHPQIVVDEQQCVFVTWTEGEYGEQLQAFYARSMDGGLTWNQPGLIDPEGQERGPAPFLGADGRLHVVWASSGHQILHAAWAGAGWSEPTLVAGFQGHNPWVRGVADSNGDLHVVWSFSGSDPTVNHSMSSDSGRTWSPRTVIGRGPWRADLAVRLGCELIAVWGNEGRLYYSILETNAPAWTPAPMPPTPTPTFRPTATASPLPVVTATMTPSPTPVAETSASSNPIDPNRGATYSLIAGVVPVLVFLALVVLIRSLQRGGAF